MCEPASRAAGGPGARVKFCRGRYREGRPDPATFCWERGVSGCAIARAAGRYPTRGPTLRCAAPLRPEDEQAGYWAKRPYFAVRALSAGKSLHSGVSSAVRRLLQSFWRCYVRKRRYIEAVILPGSERSTTLLVATTQIQASWPRGWLSARPKTPGGARRRMFFQRQYPHDILRYSTRDFSFLLVAGTDARVVLGQNMLPAGPLRRGWLWLPSLCAATALPSTRHRRRTIGLESLAQPSFGALAILAVTLLF